MAVLAGSSLIVDINVAVSNYFFSQKFYYQGVFNVWKGYKTIGQICFYPKVKEAGMLTEKRNITPQKAVEILKKHGIIVTLEEAKMMLDLMYRFAKLAVNQGLKK